MCDVTAAELDCLVKKLRANAEVPLLGSAEFCQNHESRPTLNDQAFDGGVQLEAVREVGSVRLKDLNDAFVRFRECRFDRDIVLNRYRLHAWVFVKIGAPRNQGDDECGIRIEERLQ